MKGYHFSPDKKRKEIRTYVLVEETLVVRIAQQLVRFPFVVVVYVGVRQFEYFKGKIIKIHIKQI